MEKSEIVVGGIYECDIALTPKSVRFNQALVIAIDAPMIDCRLMTGNSFSYQHVRPVDLIKQIGYDATYSDEYKKAQQEFNWLSSLVESCKVIIAESQFSDNPLALYDLMDAYLTNVSKAKTKAKSEMDSIKAQSWEAQS